MPVLSDFTTGRPTADIETLYDRANRFGARENQNAIQTLCAALTLTHSREEAYAPVVRRLSELLSARGDHRAALSAAWYAEDPSRQRALAEKALPIDQARTLSLWADRGDAEKTSSYRQAAEILEGSGHLVRAAISYERAQQPDAARALWSRLGQMLDTSDRDPYAAGLARFNLARLCAASNDTTAARQATVAAVHRLEEAADRFESIGQRERAFDCYHVLVAVGRLTDTFEHVLEGYVNAIRILSEDNLRYHALRLYEHAIELAEEAVEHAAGASLARDMTDYARKQGLERVASRGIVRQATLWQASAEAMIERRGPLELVENALLASLLAHAEAGQYQKVAALYTRLESLDIGAVRKKHYGRAASRYREAQNATLESGPLDERFGRHVEPPDVWHVDLLEWEEKGVASEACADVVLDPEEQSDSITRRNALVGRLVALGAEAAPGDLRQRADVLLADSLRPIELYSLLAPLERLYDSPDPVVRVAAVRALSHYFYKRTFVTLEDALRDDAASVVDVARTALGRLSFDHAFDPLARIYRTSDGINREAALKAIARIDTVEAAELLLAALDHGGPGERKVAMKALENARGSQFVSAARDAYPGASARLRQAISQVLKHRNVSV